ncbi:hypothetical protein SRHO_G00230760 [Serrasalmus rhombeus]
MTLSICMQTSDLSGLEEILCRIIPKRAVPPGRKQTRGSLCALAKELITDFRIKVYSQSTAYAFTYVSGLVAHPSASVLYTGLRLYVAKRLPSALHRCNALGTNKISLRRSEVLKEHYQTLLDTARKKTPGSSSPDLFPPTGGDLGGSAGSSRCSPGFAAGASSTVWAT